MRSPDVYVSICPGGSTEGRSRSRTGSTRSRRAVERLGRYPGVRVQLSPLTGRVLVEYDERQVRLEDLRAELAGLEPPDLPGADRPDDPLAVGPLVQSAVRTVSTALGFGWLALRRLTGPAG